MFAEELVSSVFGCGAASLGSFVVASDPVDA